MSDFQYTYNVGKRVGLLARVTDAHDKGNIVLLIEGTDLHIQLPQGILLGGVDLICAKLREKAAMEAAPAVTAEPLAEPGAPTFTYPCGCTATGENVPGYCPDHGQAPAAPADAAPQSEQAGA